MNTYQQALRAKCANHNRFAGKVAIVTGGGAGIGQAIVEEFAKEGAAVVFSGQTDRGKPVEANLRTIGHSVHFLQGDMADETFRAKLVAEAETKFGRIDCLINNAASFIAKGMQATVEDWRRILDVNIVGYAGMVQAAVPVMEQNREGTIVNVSSISGYIAQNERWTYNTTKAAILELTRCQALDLSPFAIRVNSVSPGWIWTPQAILEAQGDRDKWDPIWGKFHMLRRCGEAWEVARAVLFLCSDDASFITATDLAVDGGYMGLGPEGLGETAYAAIEANRQ